MHICHEGKEGKCEEESGDNISCLRVMQGGRGGSCSFLYNCTIKVYI